MIQPLLYEKYNNLDFDERINLNKTLKINYYILNPFHNRFIRHSDLSELFKSLCDIYTTDLEMLTPLFFYFSLKQKLEKRFKRKLPLIKLTYIPYDEDNP